MQLISPHIREGEPIPGEFAFCLPDPDSHVTLGPNRNPALSWNGLPAGSRSLVLVCHDPDVPSRPDDVNQDGRLVPAELPRIDFFHWVVVDLSPDLPGIETGTFSDTVTAGGKTGPGGPLGTRVGLNDYSNWFAGDADMGGQYFGYDGPCPPWNDSIVHHYCFTLYALDVARCPVEGVFTGADVLAAIETRILARAGLTGTYTLNPDLGA
jgi:Raf kinase inhibitor-like YbhB/YbcL family protein